MVDSVTGTSRLLPDAPTLIIALKAGFSAHGSYHRLITYCLQHRYGVTCKFSQSLSIHSPLSVIQF